MVVLLLFTLLACGAWYLTWRRLYPDAGRLVQQRRSRAAEMALKALDRLPRGAADLRAAHIAATVTAYLQQRLDLLTAEPTPAEAASHLRTTGCPDALAQEAESFFRTCDAVRFFPEAKAIDLPASARQLILDLEAHTWSALPPP